MKKLLVGFTLALALAACGAQTPVVESQPISVSQPSNDTVVLYKHTKTLGSAPKSGFGAQAFSSVAQNLPELIAANSDLSVIVFAGSSAYARGLQPGDVISAPPNQVVADGFLRKVLAVRDLGYQVELDTEEAELDEAIQEADTEQEMDLTQNDITSVAFANGTQLSGQQLRAQQLGTRATVNIGLINIPVPATELCTGSNGNKVVGSGQINANLKVFVKVKFGLFSIREVKTGIQGTQTINLKSSGRCNNGNVDKDQTIATMRFNTKVAWIGPIPVVITPFYTIKLQANGTITDSISFDINQSFSGRYGAHWKKGQGTSVLNEATLSFGSQTGIAASKTLNLRYTLRAEAGLKFYGGVVTLFVFAKPSVEFIAVSTGNTTDKNVFAGLNVGIGGRAKIFGKNLGSINIVDLSVARIHVFGTNPNAVIPASNPAPNPTPEPRPQPTCPRGQRCDIQ
jgi:hypothetical protein